jgi:hypothetical protein
MKKPWLVPAAGVLAIVVIVIAFAVGGESPDADDSLRKVVSFYRDNDSDQMIAAALLAWGTALFMVFATGLWRLLRDAETERRGASSLLLVGSALWAVGASIFAGLTFTLGDVADDISPAAIQALNALNSDMFFTVALGAFAFSMGAGVSILQTALLPKWLGWAAVVIGIVAITPAGFFGFLAMGLWIVVASVVLGLRARSTPAQAAP